MTTPTPEALAQVARIRAQHSEGHSTTLPNGPHPECDVCDLLSALTAQARGYVKQETHNAAVRTIEEQAQEIADLERALLSRMEQVNRIEREIERLKRDVGMGTMMLSRIHAGLGMEKFVKEQGGASVQDVLTRVREIVDATWEAAAKIADRITVLMGERDDATGAYPNDDTLGAVACGVNIAAEIRAAAQQETP